MLAKIIGKYRKYVHFYEKCGTSTVLFSRIFLYIRYSYFHKYLKVCLLWPKFSKQRKSRNPVTFQTQELFNYYLTTEMQRLQSQRSSKMNKYSWHMIFLQIIVRNEFCMHFGKFSHLHWSSFLVQSSNDTHVIYYLSVSLRSSPDFQNTERLFKSSCYAKTMLFEGILRLQNVFKLNIYLFISLSSLKNLLCK